MTYSIDQLRRDAKTLKKACESGEERARQRLKNFNPSADPKHLKHADFLHIIARENGYRSWPSLKSAIEIYGLDKAAKIQRLRGAVHLGQMHIVDQLLEDTPDLPQGNLGLEIALYDIDAVRSAIGATPKLATQKLGMAPPLVHLAHSRMIHKWPERAEAMLAIADLLLEYGADVDLGAPSSEGSDNLLSPLYFAIGHSDNMPLGRRLLEHGANPNDGESLYHSTELGHNDGLELLLEFGADQKGTNALLRSLDFDNVEAVQMLLRAGASTVEFNTEHVAGEPPIAIPALHQAARRMCSPAIIKLLLDAGADPQQDFEGCNAYGYARVFGNVALADAIARRGAVPKLTREETILANAADGSLEKIEYIDPEKLPAEYRAIIGSLLNQSNKLPHIKRLADIGVEYDRPDQAGVTPVQTAGWEGTPDSLEYLLSLKPDLSHVNHYGGTLLGTIIHGSENCPDRTERNHVACLKLAMKAGVALPHRVIESAGNEAVAEFLKDWAAAHPGQVVMGS